MTAVIGARARRAIDHVAGQARGAPLDRRLRVTINFHPELPTDGVTVLRALARDGSYRSQFETGVTSGDPSARPGGGRWDWERRLFGGAYDAALPSERPKYGALDDRGRAVGAAPRFGPVHLRLTESTLDRTTFCYPDSGLEPEAFAVARRCDLLEVVERSRQVRRSAEDDYIDYVEAQVHGRIDLARDVEAIVLDPCYAGTEVERVAADLPCPVQWHGGFRLDVGAVLLHAAYRDAHVAQAAVRLARSGVLDALAVGAAWRDGRCPTRVLLHVWHYVAWFGAAAPSGTSPGGPDDRDRLQEGLPRHR